MEKHIRYFIFYSKLASVFGKVKEGLTQNPPEYVPTLIICGHLSVRLLNTERVREPSLAEVEVILVLAVPVAVPALVVGIADVVTPGGRVGHHGGRGGGKVALELFKHSRHDEWPTTIRTDQNVKLHADTVSENVG